MNNVKYFSFILLLCKNFIISLSLSSTVSFASEWSKTELFYLQGKLHTPNFAGGGKYATTIITLQHASGWKYGDNFFIVHLNDGNLNGFSDRNFYGEMYLHFSANKMFETKISLGFIKDVGVVAGINAGADPNVIKYLPGIRISWDIPGFDFLNSDITAFIYDNDGIREGTANAPSEENNFMIDISHGYPFFNWRV